MKGKQLAILLLLLVLLGSAGYKLQRNNSSSWTESPASSGKKIIDFPINDVTRIVLKKSDGELNLVKKEDTWVVQERADYPANFPQVSELLRKLWDLKSVQRVEAGPSQLGRFDLLDPGKGDNSGTLVELKDKDGKTLAALLIGKKFMGKSEGMPPGMDGFPAGRYVMPPGGKISLVSESLEGAETNPERWLLRDFVRIDNPRSIALAGSTDALRWKVGRADAAAEWKLIGTQPEETLDPSKVTSLASQLASLTFTDVLAPDAGPEETGLDKPTVLTIETFDGFSYMLKIGKLSGESYPVLITLAANFPKERAPGKDEKEEDKTKLDQEFQTKLKTLEDKLAAEKKIEGQPYLIAKSTIDALLKERTTLLAEKKPEPAAAAAPSSKPIEAVTPPVAVPPLPSPVPEPPAKAPESNPVPPSPQVPPSK